MTQFDLKNLKFKELSDMKIAKNFNGTMNYHEGYVYTIGGNEKDSCERYDVYSNKWEPIESYSNVAESKELSTFTMIYIS